MKKILVLLFIAITSYSFTVAQTEYGIASYYGTYFHGRTTASGEKYNQFALTAAHKTLKLGTIVKVTNPQNNKSVIVKINDRGPYIKGRVIDLSTKAAELLGYRNKGTAYVKIEIVKKDKIPGDIYKAPTDNAKQDGITENDSAVAFNSANNSWKDIPTVNDESKSEEPANIPLPPVTDKKEADTNSIINRSTYFIINKIGENDIGFYGLQLGIFSDISDIFTLSEELELKYKQSLIVQQVLTEGKINYKLFIGKYQNRAYADALKLNLSEKFKDAFVVRY